MLVIALSSTGVEWKGFIALVDESMFIFSPRHLWV